MEDKSYTSQISHFIPNEGTYHFTFLLTVLEQYNGAGNLDETLDDNLTYYIISPILRRKSEYQFEYIWKNQQEDTATNTLTIRVKVNDTNFDYREVIDQLRKENMLSGLRLYKEEYGGLTLLYSEDISRNDK